MKLFSYCLKSDTGLAPNPFWGRCSLALGKPKIRLLAKAGDWVVGLGWKKSRLGDYQRRVIYAMKVNEKIPMLAYDRYCRARHDDLRHKIPDINSADFRNKAGDCIYDYAATLMAAPDPEQGELPPVLRASLHTEKNRKKDMKGKNVLISDCFYYFGRNAVTIPERFCPMIQNGQGQKIEENDPIKDEFLEWLRSLKRNPTTGEIADTQDPAFTDSVRRNKIYGDPIDPVEFSGSGATAAAEIPEEDDED